MENTRRHKADCIRPAGSFILNQGMKRGLLKSEHPKKMEVWVVENSQRKVDFSHSMVSIARRKNKKQINKGTVKVLIL